MKRMICRVLWMFLFTFLLYQQEATAAFVTKDQALRVATNWLQEKENPFDTKMGNHVQEIVYFHGESYGNPGYYVVFLNPSGWLVIPADDGFEPVIAFGENVINSADWSKNPLSLLLRIDLPQDAAPRLMTTSAAAVINDPIKKQQYNRWQKLLQKAPSNLLRQNEPYYSKDDIEDHIIVAPLLGNNLWEQAELRNYTESRIRRGPIA